MPKGRSPRSHAREPKPSSLGYPPVKTTQHPLSWSRTGSFINCRTHNSLSMWSDPTGSRKSTQQAIPPSKLETPNSKTFTINTHFKMENEVQRCQRLQWFLVAASQMVMGPVAYPVLGDTQCPVLSHVERGPSWDTNTPQLEELSSPFPSITPPPKSRSNRCQIWKQGGMNWTSRYEGYGL